MKKQSLTNVNKLGRLLYLILIMVFFLSIITQFFLAGLAIFVNPVNWVKHTTFIHLFGFNIPVILLLLAYIGRLPRWAYWHIFGLLVGVFGMYFTANITAIYSWVGALHPIIAIVLFGICYQALMKTTKLIFNKQKGEK